MSYTPTTDFLALLRNTAAGLQQAEVPGLDYVLAALARAGLFTLSVGQTAPTANQTTTVWLQPANPSWSAEGSVFLWNSVTGAYAPATAALWSVLLASVTGYVFQSISNISGIVAQATSLAAVQRASPAATTLFLPSALTRGGAPLQIVDWSTTVTLHAVTLSPANGETIMRQAAWQLFSTPDQLAGVTLHPSVDLKGWVIAP